MGNDKENVSEILTELNKVLSGLAKEDRKKVEEEFRSQPEPEPKPESKPQPVQEIQVEKQPQIKAEPLPQLQPVVQPEEKPKEEVPSMETFSPVSIDPASVKTPSPPLSSAPAPDSAVVPPAPPKISPSPEAAGGVPPAVPESQVQVPAPETGIQKKEAPQVLPPPIEEEEKIPPEQTFNLACFYPKGENDIPDIFFTNLSEVLKKTTKKEYQLGRSIVEAIDYNTFDYNNVIQKCNSVKSIEAIFFISPEPLEIEKDKLFYFNITVDKVNKRFLYVDFAVELMLIKKK